MIELELSPAQVQAAIYFVIGIIIIEGIWLAYLTFMMWRRHKREQASKVEQAEPRKEEAGKK